MNILFVAPNMQDINAIPEIRSITSTHKTHVLNGTVTLQDIYQAVTHQEYDVIHIVAHMTADHGRLDEIILSGNHVLDMNSAVRVAKLANAKLVMFSSCMAARFAAYMVNHGVPCVVYTTVEIQDSTAWELPSSFYEQCKRAERQEKNIDFRSIFNSVDSADGCYGILVSDVYYTVLMQPLYDALSGLTKRVDDLYKILEEHGYSLPNITGVQQRLVVIVLIVLAALIALASTIIVGEYLWAIV